MKLIEKSNGDVKVLATGDFDSIKKYLLSNDLFSWILDEEPEREIPNIAQVEDAGDLVWIFKEYDYSWWTLELEGN